MHASSKLFRTQEGPDATRWIAFDSLCQRNTLPDIYAASIHPSPSDWLHYVILLCISRIWIKSWLYEIYHSTFSQNTKCMYEERIRFMGLRGFSTIRLFATSGSWIRCLPLHESEPNRDSSSSKARLSSAPVSMSVLSYDVRKGNKLREESLAATSAHGGLSIFWSDTRYGSMDLYALRFPLPSRNRDPRYLIPLSLVWRVVVNSSSYFPVPHQA